MILFIYLFGAKKADRFTVVIESVQSLLKKCFFSLNKSLKLAKIYKKLQSTKIFRVFRHEFSSEISHFKNKQAEKENVSAVEQGCHAS